MASRTWGFSQTWTGSLPVGSPLTGLDGGVQTGFMYDGPTGKWYAFTNYIVGVSASALPADGAFDIFVAQAGRSVKDFEGEGSFFSVNSVAQVGLIRNSDGNVIGVQSGLISNVSIGGYRTFTALYEIDGSPFSGQLQLGTDLWNAVQALYAFMERNAIATWDFIDTNALRPTLDILRDPLVLDLDGDGIETIALSCPHRSIPISDSDRSRSVIPELPDQAFRLIPISRSSRSRSACGECGEA